MSGMDTFIQTECSLVAGRGGLREGWGGGARGMPRGGLVDTGFDSADREVLDRVNSGDCTISHNVVTALNTVELLALK